MIFGDAQNIQEHSIVLRLDLLLFEWDHKLIFYSENEHLPFTRNMMREFSRGTGGRTSFITISIIASVMRSSFLLFAHMVGGQLDGSGSHIGMGSSLRMLDVDTGNYVPNQRIFE